MITVPAVTPVTTPPVETVADELLADHVPPPVVLVSVIVEPTLTAFAPVIVPALGNELTVIDLVVVAVPQLLVTI
jgi:hypothetical protein